MYLKMKALVLGIAVVAILVHTTLSAAPSSTCVSGSKTINIDTKTAVCLVLNSLNYTESPSYSQIPIFPRADTFTRFDIGASWAALYDETAVVQPDPLLAKYGLNVGFHIESEGYISYQKRFRDAEYIASDGTYGRTFSIFTAIISVDKGKVNGIAWDDGCHFCAHTYCDTNTFDYGTSNSTIPDSSEDCFWEDNRICVDPTDPSLVSDVCQLQVYVVWAGTDSKGNNFQSQQKRLGNFAGRSVGNYITDTSNTFTTAAQRITS